MLNCAVAYLLMYRVEDRPLICGDKIPRSCKTRLPLVENISSSASPPVENPSNTTSLTIEQSSNSTPRVVVGPLNISSQPNKTSIDSTQPKTGLNVCCQIALDVIRHTWKQITMLKHMKLLIVTLSYAVLLTGISNYSAIVPFAMADSGHSPSDASYCYSLGAVANTVTRLFICCFSDSSWFSRKVSFLVGSILSACASLGNVFFPQFPFNYI